MVLDGRNGNIALGIRRGIGLGLDGRSHCVGHVFEGVEAPYLRARADALVGASARNEPVSHQVAFFRRKVLHAGQGHVMIRQHEPLGRDKRARCATDADCGQAQRVQPRRPRHETILRLQSRGRRTIERPQSLFGACRSGRDVQSGPDQSGANVSYHAVMVDGPVAARYQRHHIHRSES